MARRRQEPLEKVTLNITEGDKETLANFYPALGWSVAARIILNKACNRLRELESQEVVADTAALDIKLPNIEGIGGMTH